MSFPSALYKVLIKNALAYIYFSGKLARISSIWPKVNPVMSAINVSSAYNLKESIYNFFSGIEENNLVFYTFSVDVILGPFHTLHNNKTVQFL